MTPQVVGVLVMMVVISLAIPMFIRTHIWNKFLRNMNANKDQEALDILNSNIYRLLFGNYNQKWNLLRFYISRENNQEVTNRVNNLLSSSLSKDQAYQVFSNAFFYFLALEDKEMTYKLLNRLDGILASDQKEYFYMLYRVVIEKKSEDIEIVKTLIDEKEKEAETKSRDYQLGILQYLLGVQYYNSNNPKEGEKWLKKAKNNAKGTPFKKQVKKYLDKDK